MNPFQDLINMKAAYDAEVAKYGKDKFESMFLDFFKRHTCVEKILWTQGTPGFNDGDPCYFSVGEAHVKLTLEFCKANTKYSRYAYTLEDLEKLDPDDDDDDSAYPEGPAWTQGYGLQGEGVDLEQANVVQSAIDELADIMDCSDVLESVFGDGQKIIVYRDNEGGVSIDMEDYYDG